MGFMRETPGRSLANRSLRGIFRVRLGSGVKKAEGKKVCSAWVEEKRPCEKVDSGSSIWSLKSLEKAHLRTAGVR